MIHYHGTPITPRASLLAVSFGQFTAKVAGGVLWSLLLAGVLTRQEARA